MAHPVAAANQQVNPECRVRRSAIRAVALLGPVLTICNLAKVIFYALDAILSFANTPHVCRQLERSFMGLSIGFGMPVLALIALISPETILSGSNPRKLFLDIESKNFCEVIQIGINNDIFAPQPY